MFKIIILAIDSMNINMNYWQPNEILEFYITNFLFFIYINMLILFHYSVFVYW